MSRAGTVALVNGALAAAASAVAVWALARPDPPPPPAPPPGCDCATDAGAEAMPVAAPLEPPELERHAVCPAGASPPRWAEVHLWGAPSWVVHCGDSVHVIGFDRGAHRPRPLRIARFDAPPPDAGLTAYGGTPAEGDLDGDGTPELLLPLRWLEPNGNARAGAVYAVTGGRSGPVSARRALEVAAGHLAFPGGDAKGRALLALHTPGPDAASEAWLVAPGPRPRPETRRALGGAGGWVAWLDVDGDGRPEPLAGGPGVEGVERVDVPAPVPVDGGGPADPLASVPPTRGALSVDVDGDGRDDLVLLGEDAWLLLAGGGGKAERVEAARGLSELSAFDVDSDGRIELLGHDDTGAVLLQRGAGDRFERREWFRIEGEGVTPQSLRAAHVDADTRTDVLVLAVSAGPEPWVELGVVSAAAEAPRVRLAKTASPLADAPLSLRIALP